MGNEQFTGILAATVTPFTADASAVDEAAIHRIVDYIVDNGIHGLVPGGSTGEFTTLSHDERKRTAEVYLEAGAGRVPVVVGTGALSTAETVELSKHANASGAAAVMVVPPFYDAPTWDELLAHYGAVSDAIDIPIMYYNIPSATGVDLSPEQFAELARKTRVTCFKDTGGDASKFAAVRQHYAADITALNGYDTLTFGALAAGATAGVWGVASVLPRQCVDLYDALAVRRDLDEARSLWAKLFPVCEFLETVNYAGGIKTGLELVGQNPGPSRRPILPMAKEQRAEYAGLLRAAGTDVVDD